MFTGLHPSRHQVAIESLDNRRLCDLIKTYADSERLLNWVDGVFLKYLDGDKIKDLIEKGMSNRAYPMHDIRRLLSLLSSVDQTIILNVVDLSQHFKSIQSPQELADAILIVSHEKIEMLPFLRYRASTILSSAEDLYAALRGRPVGEIQSILDALGSANLRGLLRDAKDFEWFMKSIEQSKYDMPILTHIDEAVLKGVEITPQQLHDLLEHSARDSKDVQMLLRCFCPPGGRCRITSPADARVITEGLPWERLIQTTTYLSSQRETTRHISEHKEQLDDLRERHERIYGAP